jgi:hypothetical protein
MTFLLLIVGAGLLAKVMFTAAEAAIDTWVWRRRVRDYTGLRAEVYLLGDRYELSSRSWLGTVIRDACYHRTLVLLDDGRIMDPRCSRFQWRVVGT